MRSMRSLLNVRKPNDLSLNSPVVGFETRAPVAYVM